jgi:uncharacterized protein YjbI with pentapeptide repeats
MNEAEQRTLAAWRSLKQRDRDRVIRLARKSVAKTKAEMERLGLDMFCLEDADLSGITLKGGPRFNGGLIIRCNFNGSDLGLVQFSRVNLSGSTFIGAKLVNVGFLDCDLSGVDFSGADLEGGFFAQEEGTLTLSGAVFDGALVQETSFQEGLPLPFTVDAVKGTPMGYSICRSPFSSGVTRFIKD